MGEAFGPGMPVPQKPWFHRNWKWLLPVGCLGTIVLFATFVGGIFFVVETSFRAVMRILRLSGEYKPIPK